MDACGPLSAALAQRVLAAPPGLAGNRLVCVDGPAGSGKTTLAGKLATVLADEVAVVHMDHPYGGWTLTGAVARLMAGVLRPLAEGRDGRYHRYDRAAARFSPSPTSVPVPAVLVVEGCGSASLPVDPWAVLRVWVEADPALRLTRGIACDGEHLAAEWQRWQRVETEHFRRDGSRTPADVVVDGGA